VTPGDKTPKGFAEGSELTFNPEFLKRNGYNKLSDLSILFPSTNRDAWEKIGLPQSGISNSGGISNDGENPAAPKSVSASGKNLSWSSSESNDVVGYRIFRANNPDGSFSQFASTTRTSFTVPDNAVYHVKAVDYFGQESSASNVVKVGKT